MTSTAIIQQLPCWQYPITIEPLEGGITNHNFIVTEARPENSRAQFVVRIGHDIPVHQIMRFNEAAAGTAAHAAGLSPAIRYRGDGVLVMDYIDSRALDATDVRQQSMLLRIVPLLKSCHYDVPRQLRGASLVFWVFHVIRDYVGTLRDDNSTHLQTLPTLLIASEELESAAGPFDIVFGHNDLLPANFLDDGTRLWLIDWEYAGFNSPLFDLGGLASNNELTETQERWLLDAYFEQAVTDDLWRRYQAMKCASLLRETLWSMVSEIHSTLDFNYAAYTRENLQRFEASFAEFKAL